MTDEPAARIVVIRKSLAAFVCGIFGFLPVVGFFPALYTLACLFAIRARHRDQWNPASAYLRCGVALSLLGVLGGALIIAAAILCVGLQQLY